ncbi:hypothetical protein G7Y89_g10346 [Cudoniella acicularis]|uniref:phosphogluconate dehydrogenase (NADP(+)-dependent, decarboxylating) n=1 Tax=Cudoniella acicularis TaxID=354080 RepID=A0A8H4RCY6_9HELO|nr:hypothetical protein G7Y89_g10346 [Cudoniella acicularis]
MCPGGEEKAMDIVMPLLEKMAAKDPEGKPCVGKIGMGGAGNYVKMIHNGIEHGMMSAISEAWTIMNKRVEMKYDDIGKVFEKWSSKGELSKLVQISANKKTRKDTTFSEMFKIKSYRISMAQKELESGPTPKQLLYTSLHRPSQRLTTSALSPPTEDNANMSSKPSTASSSLPNSLSPPNLRKRPLSKTSEKQTNGQSPSRTSSKYGKLAASSKPNHISFLLSAIFSPTSKYPHKSHNLLYEPTIVGDLKNGFESLKRVVAKGVKCNAVVPSMKATLEYLKYSGNLELPTSFYEAELDYFGKHMFDSKSLDKGPGKPETGKHHFEWKPA